jgi:hypothetical protein
MVAGTKPVLFRKSSGRRSFPRRRESSPTWTRPDPRLRGGDRWKGYLTPFPPRGRVRQESARSHGALSRPSPDGGIRALYAIKRSTL